MIKMLCGDEPYLIQKEKESVVSTVLEPDFNLSAYQKFDAEVYDVCFTYPVVEDKRVVVVDADTFSVINNDAFKKYLDEPSDFCDLVVIIRNADFSSAFAKSLKKNLTVCDKLKQEGDLKREVLSKVSKAGARISDDALAEFIKRQNYFERSDINLHSVMNDLQTLLDLSREISLDMIKSHVKNHDIGNVFLLSKLLLNGNSKELKRQCALISTSADEVFRVLGLLQREFRIAYKQKYFAPAQIDAKYFNLKNLSKPTLLKGLGICTDISEQIKDGKIGYSVALDYAIMQLVHLVKQDVSALM